MSAPVELQLSLLNEQLHLWAIDRLTGAAAPAAELRLQIVNELGRAWLTRSIADRAFVELPLPSRRHSAVSSSRLHLFDLAALPLNARSASVRWFAQIGQLCRRLVDEGRLRPQLIINEQQRRAVWRPVPGDDLVAIIDQLGATLPAVCAVVDVDELVAVTADALARRRLNDIGWRPQAAGFHHDARYRAAQATMRALASGSSAVLYRVDDLALIDELQPVFDEEALRARGVAVTVPQLRLIMPESPQEDWALRLELVDADSGDRWCTGADLADGNQFVLDLAGERRRVSEMRVQFERAGVMIGQRLPALAQLIHDPMTDVSLELAQVEEFLTATAVLLDELQVRLVGPEQLVRVKAAVRATARAQSPRRTHNV